RYSGEVFGQRRIRRLEARKRASPCRVAQSHYRRRQCRSESSARMSTLELEGQTAIVTGAGKNIGRAIGLDLAAGGASVAVVVRSDKKSADNVVKDIEARGGKAMAILADIANQDDIARMLKETLSRFGRLDILVNNAGIRPEAPVEEITLK